MKMREMALLLRDFTGFMERHAPSKSLADIGKVADLFDTFPEEGVAGFCSSIAKAREPKPPKAPKAKAVSPAELASQIKHYLDHRAEYDHSRFEALLAPIAKLTMPQLKALGEAIGCPVAGKKPDMVGRLQQWLRNIKISDDQTEFRLSPNGHARTPQAQPSLASAW